MNTYNKLPIVLTRGKGTRVWDSDGKEYIDFMAGLAVCNLGHCHPRLTEAICRQAETLIHVSNLYHIEPQIELAKRMAELSFADRFFYCNSGAEANEGAFKLARKWAKDNKYPDCYEVITFEKSFHGRTLSTVAATGQNKVKAGFEPLPEGYKHVPFNDLDAVAAAVTEKTCAVMVEPIQGEGGVNVPAPGFLEGLRALCDEQKLLLIFDEIQVGMGRTGTLFAYEGFGVTPDIMTLAKSIAGGVPMGSFCAREQVAKSLAPGMHAATFGGNPLACAAAIATFKTIEEEDLLENCRKMGQYMMEKLASLKDSYPVVKEVRGKGLIIALQLDRPGAPIVTKMREKGFLINCIQDSVLRFLPPLIISRPEIDQMIEVLDQTIKEELN